MCHLPVSVSLHESAAFLGHMEPVRGAVRGANWAQDTLNIDQLSCLN